jgi:hypothetical protein
VNTYTYIIHTYINILYDYINEQLVLYTYSVGGVTEADFKLAEAVDAVPVTYSKNWKKNHPDVLPLPGHRLPKALVKQYHEELLEHHTDENSPYNKAGTLHCWTGSTVIYLHKCRCRLVLSSYMLY